MNALGPLQLFLNHSPKAQTFRKAHDGPRVGSRATGQRVPSIGKAFSGVDSKGCNRFRVIWV